MRSLSHILRHIITPILLLNTLLNYISIWYLKKKCIHFRIRKEEQQRSLPIFFIKLVKPKNRIFVLKNISKPIFIFYFLGNERLRRSVSENWKEGLFCLILYLRCAKVPNELVQCILEYLEQVSTCPKSMCNRKIILKNILRSKNVDFVYQVRIQHCRV